MKTRPNPKTTTCAIDFKSKIPTRQMIDRSGRIRFVHSGFHGEETTRQYANEIEQLLKEPKP